MTKAELQQEILKLLKTSTIPQHDKNMIEILLPVMKDDVLQNTYTALVNEQNKMVQLSEKKKRIELKYKVMVEKLSDIRSGK